MNDKKLFSLHYSKDTQKHEDKPKFRNRMLKYLEDFVARGFPNDTNIHCRKEMGIDLLYKDGINSRRYLVEETFSDTSITIVDILDFITVVFDSLSPHKSKLGTDYLDNFSNEINRIFREESMCYVLDDAGRVRYFPDKEFHSLVKSTLAQLGHPKYAANLNAFNNVLDQAYKNHGTESPIRDLFHCIEGFTLTLLNDKKFIMLQESSINKLIDIITSKTQEDSSFTDNDRDALSNLKVLFLKWATMCHKYRHAKSQQENHNVPKFQFDFIFSTGVSIFRLLLEIDVKYNLSMTK